MKLITAIVRPFKVDDIRHALSAQEPGRPLLRPGEVDPQQCILERAAGKAGQVPMDDGDEDDGRRGPDQKGDEPFLEVVEETVDHGLPPSRLAAGLLKKMPASGAGIGTLPWISQA